jgi:hypothetical protein
MQYLSLIIILSGIGLIIYTVLKGNKKGLPGRYAERRNNFNYSDDREIEIHDEVRDITEDILIIEDGNDDFINRDRPATKRYHKNMQNDIELDQPPVSGEYDNDESVSHSIEKNRAEGDKTTVILYDDKSRIIDYDNSGNVIDPTLEEYKKLKRIGRGTIEMVKDGINFHLKKKLYRFDYYRIEKMNMGKNFLSVNIKGGDVTRLFIFENKSPLISDIFMGYNSYRKNLV